MIKKTIKIIQHGIASAIWGILTLTVSLHAQGADSYTGVGESSNLASARADAQVGLNSQIQGTFSHSFTQILKESGGITDNEITLITASRSNLFLREVTETVTTTGDGLYRVTRSITKETLRRLFDERKQRIREYIHAAETALNKTESPNVGMAFTFFYWAHLLSLAQPDTVLIDVDGAPRITIVAIQEIWNKMLERISIQPVKRVDDEMVVWKCEARYGGKPISELSFEFYDGNGVTEGKVERGEAQVTLFFKDAARVERDIPLTVVYKSREQMDDLLLYADTLMGNRHFNEIVTLKLSDPSSDEKNNAADSMNSADINFLPKPLQELLSVKSDISKIMELLRSFVKQRQIIIGREDEFDSLNDLFGLVLGKEGIAAALAFREGKYVDVLSGKETSLKEHSGKRITWVEVLH